MKDVTLKFSSQYITIFKDYIPKPPYLTDKDSILNSLELVRDTFKFYERFFYEAYTAETSNYLVEFKVGEFFHLCIDNERYIFFIDEKYRIKKEVDRSFGLLILDRAIEKILS